MAGKSAFTEGEWEDLRRGVTGAGLLVSVADRSFFEGFKEAGALARHLAQARRSESSQLVRELASTGGTGFSLTTAPDELERGTIDALRAAVAALTAKAPEELDDYRAFVLEVARSVAEAAGGVEEAERTSLARIREALGAGAET